MGCGEPWRLKGMEGYVGPEVFGVLRLRLAWVPTSAQDDGCFCNQMSCYLAEAPDQWKARPPWAIKGEPRVRVGVRATWGR